MILLLEISRNAVYIKVVAYVFRDSRRRHILNCHLQQIFL